ncbi:IclR family transcriptional regulator [Ruania alba]|uniref:DNA-binding transcriptional regulator, IclR family n=1 Tax=Ruania alba TaxID=648782 RepID=A0A1H5LGR0_9MICO|nr:IclR family transcriptional regulator [Ruania alba]SEE76220.1 DNA-binding transcriptional regulator, IclR family [Ruania alba]
MTWETKGSVVGALDDMRTQVISPEAVRGPSVRSVDRALRVLEIIADEGEATLVRLARELGVHKSTVLRLNEDLIRHGLIEPAGGRSGYRLGAGCLRLAAAAATAATLDVSQVAQPVCDRLAEELEETCNVAVLREGMAVNVCQAEASTAIGTRNWIGQSTPPHATSNGKVLLAALDEGALRAALPARLERFTSRTVTARATLRQTLREVRAQGFAVAAEELEEGLNAVAAPIRDFTGAVVAALSVAGPGYRMTEEQFPRVRDAVMRGAAEISAQLGHRQR